MSVQMSIHMPMANSRDGHGSTALGRFKMHELAAGFAIHPPAPTRSVVTSISPEAYSLDWHEDLGAAGLTINPPPPPPPPGSIVTSISQAASRQCAGDGQALLVPS